MIRNGLFRYVPHERIDAYHRRGWMVAADLGPTHGQWSVLMWGCECPVFFQLNPEETVMAKVDA